VYDIIFNIVLKLSAYLTHTSLSTVELVEFLPTSILHTHTHI